MNCAIRWLIVCLLCALCAPTGWCVVSDVAVDTVTLSAIDQAYTEDAVYRNAVYLWLRVAGVVWIVVEWVAAVILWRTYRLLADHVARRGGGAHE